jgi:hypothetical protein
LNPKSILIILFFNSYFIASGQDSLFYNSGDKLAVKVLEITPTNIKYLKWNYKDGPLFIVDKSDLFKIIYQNGDIELFKRSSKTENNGLQGKNIVGVNPFLIFSGTAIISYERFYKDYRRSFKIPLYLGFSNFESYVGLELKYFVSKASKARYFLGPAFKLGTDNVDIISSIYFNNGWSFQPTKAINITFDFGVGPTFYADSETTVLQFQTGLSLGLRF